MRFRCEHCNAGYSVPDGKVRDKVVRMQCLKCKGDIVITGPHQVAAPASKPPKFRHEWWVIDDGEQYGPYSEADLVKRFKAGKLQHATHVWRKGLEGWLHIADVPEFSAFASGPGDALLTLEDPEDRPKTAVAPPPFVPVAESKPPEATAKPFSPPKTVDLTGPKREVTAVFTVKAARERTTVFQRKRRRWPFVAAAVVMLAGAAAWWLRPREVEVPPPPEADALPPPAGAGLVPPTDTDVPKRPKPVVLAAAPAKSTPLVVKVNGITFREQSSVRPAWLTAENVKRSVSLNQEALGPCLGNDNGPRGKCAVGFRIMPDGRVKNITVSPSRINDGALGKCLHEMFSAMRFPKFDGELEEVEIALSVTP